MFDKHAIMTFKMGNKPIWHHPSGNIFLAKWPSPFGVHYEIVTGPDIPVTGGWTYEPTGE